MTCLVRKADVVLIYNEESVEYAEVTTLCGRDYFDSYAEDNVEYYSSKPVFELMMDGDSEMCSVCSLRALELGVNVDV